MSAIALFIVLACIAGAVLAAWWGWVLFTTVLAVRRAARAYLARLVPLPPLPAPVQHHAPGRPGSHQ